MVGMRKLEEEVGNGKKLVDEGEKILSKAENRIERKLKVEL